MEANLKWSTCVFRPQMQLPASSKRGSDGIARTPCEGRLLEASVLLDASEMLMSIVTISSIEASAPSAMHVGTHSKRPR